MPEPLKIVALWIIAFLFAAIGAPNAHADVIHTINFTQTSGVDAAPSGTVVRSSGPRELFAQISWHGLLFQSELTAPPALLSPFPPPAGCVGGDDVDTILKILEGCSSQPNLWQAVTDLLTVGQPARFYIDSPFLYSLLILDTSPDAFAASATNDRGTFTIAPTTAMPEPGTGILVPIGIVLVMVMRRMGIGRKRAASGAEFR